MWIGLAQFAGVVIACSIGFVVWYHVCYPEPIRAWWRRKRTARNLKRRQVLSPAWWRTHEQQSSRVDYHGVTIQFPIRKEQ